MSFTVKDSEERQLEFERDRLLAEQRKARLRRQIRELGGQDPTTQSWPAWLIVRDRPELSMSDASKQVFMV